MDKKFTEKNWNDVASAIAKTFRFTAEEGTKFTSNATAKLIAAIPFEAGCDEPERTAIAHLSVYIAAIRGGRAVFDHAKHDNADILSRLRLIGSFKGGNQAVIRHGMNLLALVMVNGYKRDQAKDKASGEYNPLNDGAWDYDKTCEKLSASVKKTASTELDQYMTIEDAYNKIWD